MKFAVFSPSHDYRRFIATKLETSPPSRAKDSTPPDVTFFGKGKPDLEGFLSHEGAKIAVLSHPNLHILDQPLTAGGATLWGGGIIPDRVAREPDYVTLSAAKKGTLIAAKGNTTQRLVLCSTKEGLIPQALTYEVHNQLLPSIGVVTEEGMTLTPWSQEPKEMSWWGTVEALCQEWKYIGFLFLHLDGDGDIVRLSPYGPESFWATFIAGFDGNFAKWLDKTVTSRNVLPVIPVKETVTLKASVAPYPYLSCPWIPAEARASVEGWMRQGGADLLIPTDFAHNETKIVWISTKEVVDEASGEVTTLSTGPELAFVSGESYGEVRGALEEMRAFLPVQYKRLETSDDS